MKVSSRIETWTSPWRERSVASSASTSSTERKRTRLPQKSGVLQKVQAPGQPRELMK